MVPDLLTLAEVAVRLGVGTRRVRALIVAGRLPARRATPDEVAALLGSGRIKGVPVVGIQLVREADLELVRERRVGYPAGRPRKAHTEPTEGANE